MLIVNRSRSRRKAKTVAGFFVVSLIIVIVLAAMREVSAYLGKKQNRTETGGMYSGFYQSHPRMIKAIAIAGEDEYENGESDETGIAADTSALETSAQSAILIDTKSKNIVYEHNAYKRLPMASTTKIITAIVAIESGVSLDTVVKITKQMTGAEGSSIYLYEGERFTLNDLLYALLLNSANDSAEAIAVSVAGSIENFAVMMNEKVRELNLKDTNLTNPHGLDAEMHYTTAYDLAAITAYALENDKFLEIVSTQNLTIYPLDEKGEKTSEGARFLRNHNKLLRMYDGAVGVKTGFTKRSGRCLVSAAERDGARFVAVTINASDDWNDHMNMLNYGFKNYTTVEICGKFEYEFEMEIVNGVIYAADEKGKTVMQEVSKLKCVNISTESASLPSHIKTEDIEYRVELPRFLYAPVKKNDVIGKIIFTYKEKVIAYSAIVSLEDVSLYESKSITQKFFDIFKN